MMHVGRCLALVATILGSHRVSAEPPLIAAAANLRFALPQIAQAFERETGVAVKVVYGSTGNFRYQIAQGAPFELFLSA
ncbi:MAG: substrate-binding domain-containing protein, partial [Chromatiales bacterium]